MQQNRMSQVISVECTFTFSIEVPSCCNHYAKCVSYWFKSVALLCCHLVRLGEHGRYVVVGINNEFENLESRDVFDSVTRHSFRITAAMSSNMFPQDWFYSSKMSFSHHYTISYHKSDNWRGQNCFLIWIHFKYLLKQHTAPIVNIMRTIWPHILHGRRVR